MTAQVCTCYLGDPDDPSRDPEACAACDAAYWADPVFRLAADGTAPPLSRTRLAPPPAPALFELEPLPPAGPSISDGVRLTLRNRALLEAGVHPATHLRLALGGHSCAECEYLKAIVGHRRTYWKCDNHRLGHSHSAASDVRKGWPACELFTPAQSGPDEPPPSPTGQG